MVIYKILNKINGKIYIGQTDKELSKRIAMHINTNKTYVQRALNKYGVNAFDISIIDSADTREILHEKEIYWIKTLDCKVPKGYNLTDGGEGVGGYSHSEETRKKISKNTREAMSNLSPEKKEKLKSRKGKLGQLNYNYGKKVSPEIIEKLRLSHLGIPSGNKGKKHPYKARSPRPDMVGENNPAKRPEVREKIKANHPMKRSEVVAKFVKTKTGMKYKQETKPQKKRPPVTENTRKLLSEKTSLYWKNKRGGE